MKGFRIIAETSTPDGARFTLQEHDGEFYLKHNGRQLMSTIATVSELMLSELACEHLSEHRNPRILIGGLGLGFSLKRVLSKVGMNAEVHVAELLPEVVAWNRDLLAKVNGKLLDDCRVTVLVEDVFAVIKRAHRARYNAILLDVDNGPTSFVQAQNKRLYDRYGFALIRRALQPNGRVAFWSATDEPDFVRQLTRAGFQVRAVEAKAHEHARRSDHRIYVATLNSPTLPTPERPRTNRKAARRDSAF